MSRPLIAWGLILGFPLTAVADPGPDIQSLKRYGPAYRYTQAGWIVLHIEGEPYPRGYQHGRLLADEIAAQIRMMSAIRSPKDPARGWAQLRTLSNALFLRRFDREFLEEMKGIADGAADAGAKVGGRDGRPIDLVDVVAMNTWMETETLDAALWATPTGLEGTTFPRPNPGRAPDKAPPKPDRCSAFIATGPATADGKIVFGHVTMGDLNLGLFANVWIDIAPHRGERFVMQAFPGGIWSSQDYYINGAGIILAETTIDQTAFDIAGVPLTNRARKAIQYSRSINDVVRHLGTENNGLYTNEWLIGDIKTNEIAMFALGTRTTTLRRSSRDEWFGGTKGFYWGCNNGKDHAVCREATRPGERFPPLQEWNWEPDQRDEEWLKLYKAHGGKIDAEFGKKAFANSVLSPGTAFDAKVTTATMAAKLSSYAMFGPPTGKEWKPTPRELRDYPEIRALPAHPWTVLSPQSPRVEPN